MQTETRNLSVIAYYLSKHDFQGVSALGYSTRTDALRSISALFAHDNNYLKLRRDEFDVITGSHRKGWRNREPSSSISGLAHVLENYSFSELTNMVRDLIAIQIEHNSGSKGNSDKRKDYNVEADMEALLNGFISDATKNVLIAQYTQRVYNQHSIELLKRHYSYRCQICGINPSMEAGVNIVEVHHIVPFASRADNSLTNLVVLCPNHHRLVHTANAVFVSGGDTRFILENGTMLPLVINDHL